MERIWGLVDSVDSALWHTTMKPGSGDQGMKCAIRYYHRKRFYEFFPRIDHEKRYPTLVLKEIGALEFLKFLQNLEGENEGCR